MRFTVKSYAQDWFSALQQAEPSKWHSISHAFLEAMYREGFSARLPEVVRLITQMHYRSQGLIPVQVTSARDVSDAVIEKALEQVLPGKKTHITRVIDDSLIGGISVETLNQRWNLSVSGQLQNFAHKLH